MNTTKHTNDKTVESVKIPFLRIPVVFVLVVCLVGLVVAIELTSIHYQSHTNPNFESICAINEALNCETVARSPYSVVLGLPISVWGIFAYSIFIALAVWSLVRKRPLWGIFLFGFSCALVASGVLAYISITIIQSLCLFCSTLYVVNSLLFGGAIVSLRLHRVHPVGAVKSDFYTVLKHLRFFLPLALNVVVLLGAALMLVPPYWQQSKFSELPKLPTGIDKNGDHWMGAEDPIVTVVEYTDYECPFCRRAHLQIRMQLQRHADDVRLIHKHMPMDNKCNDYLENPYHERACEFSITVECAGKQGKFWEMNDALFGLQDIVSAQNIDIDGLVSKFKLDAEKFAACKTSGEVIQTIGAHIDKGTALKIPGTPTYFLGAQPYPGGIPEQTLKKMVDRARENESKQTATKVLKY